MQREVPGRARASCWSALLLSLCALLAAPVADAAARHPVHHAVSAKKARAATHRKAARKLVKEAAHARRTHTRHAGLAQGHARKTAQRRRQAPTHRSQALQRRAVPAQVAGTGPLRVSAEMAYVVDQQTGQVLYGKNATVVHPIASLTKLMTGMIIAKAHLPMGETITITQDDVDRLKFSSSRLKVGTALSRTQALHLALMSSENRAAHALARTYPGGEHAFVSAMNGMAAQLGMRQTHYVEPTGLSSGNESTAHDLALLTAAASREPLVRRYTTSPGYRLATDDGSLQYVNTNRLVRSGGWDIGVQKTGFINEAGPTMLMQAKLAGRRLIMVFLDSASKLSRFTDAERVRAWLHHHPEVLAKDRDAAPG
jgi:serine-type D-Ala-D-Ala endopeptidase (penicillin-binding protein 7)